MTGDDGQPRQGRGRMALLGRLAPSGEAVVRALRATVGGLVVAHLVVFVAVVALRIGYPYELEWQEGGVEDHVRRVLAGAPLYGPPSLAFTPFIYPPLYYVAGAGAAQVVGLNLTALRLVSVLATLVCLGLLYHLARRAGARRWGASLGAGLFVASYEIGGAWYDVGRVDMLLLALFFAFVAVVQRRPGRGGYALAGGLLVLAAFVKQTAVVLGAPLVLYALWTDGRRAWPLAAVTVLGGLGGLGFLHLATDGWFTYYTVELPREHTWIVSNVVKYWSHDLLRPLGIAVLLGGGLLMLRRFEGRPIGFWATLWGVALLASWLLRLHSGGYDNVLIPAYAATALFFGLGVDALDRFAESLRPAVQPLARMGLYGAVLVQFATLVYDPRDYVPTAADEAAGDRLVARLAAMERPVLLPSEGYLAARAGHDAGAHEMALYDVQRSDNVPQRRLQAEVDSLIEARHFRFIVAPFNGNGWLGLERGYQPAERLFEDDPRDEGAVFMPVSGVPRRPERIYRPAVPTPPPDGAGSYIFRNP